MKNKINLFLLSTFFVVFLFNSCSKEIVQEEREIIQYEGFSLIDGMIAFDSESTFRTILDELFENQDNLDIWEKEVEGFTSLRTKYESITDEMAEDILENIDDYKYVFTLNEEEDGFKSADRNIASDVISTLVNDEGFLQIGDIVHRFTYSYYFSTNAQNFDLLNVADIDSNHPKIEKTKIKREFIFEDISSAQTVAGIRDYTVGECTQTSGNKRVKGQIIREEIFDNDCNIKTKHQKRVFGIWWSNKTAIAVSFSGNFVKLFTDCVPTPFVAPYFALAGTADNKSSITRTVPGNHINWGGCNDGQTSPFHNGQYTSMHIGGGKVCTLACPPGSPCG